jgi:hypothetical protein
MAEDVLVACDDAAEWNVVITECIRPEIVRLRSKDDPSCPPCAYLYHASPVSLQATNWFPDAPSALFSLTATAEVARRQKLAPLSAFALYRYEAVLSGEVQTELTDTRADFLRKYHASSTTTRDSRCDRKCGGHLLVANRPAPPAVSLCASVWEFRVLPSAVSLPLANGELSPFYSRETLASPAFAALATLHSSVGSRTLSPPPPSPAPAERPRLAPVPQRSFTPGGHGRAWVAAPHPRRSPYYSTDVYGLPPRA